MNSRLICDMLLNMPLKIESAFDELRYICRVIKRKNRLYLKYPFISLMVIFFNFRVKRFPTEHPY